MSLINCTAIQTQHERRESKEANSSQTALSFLILADTASNLSFSIDNAVSTDTATATIYDSIPQFSENRLIFGELTYREAKYKEDRQAARQNHL